MVTTTTTSTTSTTASLPQNKICVGSPDCRCAHRQGRCQDVGDLSATRPSIRFSAANAFVSGIRRKVLSELLRRRKVRFPNHAQFDWILARMMGPNGGLCDPHALQHTTKINTSQDSLSELRPGRPLNKAPAVKPSVTVAVTHSTKTIPTRSKSVRTVNIDPATAPATK